MAAYLKEHGPDEKKRIIRKKWKQEDSERLLKLVGQYGPKWKSFESEFPGRAASCIKSHYETRTGNSQLILTAEEKEILTREIESMQGDDVDWKMLQKSLLPSIRSITAIKKYYYGLNVKRYYERWTEDEVNQLGILVEKYGTKSWDKVVKEMKGRSSIQCQAKWFYESSIRNKAPYLDSILKEKSETIEEEQEVILSEPQSCLIDTRPAIIDNSTKREKAVIVILVRNNELNPMRRTLREFEDRFNRKFNYPYVFLNDEPFSDEFKQSISALTNAEIEFGLVPSEMWSVPNHVNETLMNERLTDYASRNIMYGGSLSYRHMCRFNSGFFYRHPLLEKYDYYWRVEPGVHFYCDLDYDPFSFMKENGKEYGFTITLKEIPETIPTLWEHTLKFAHEKQLNTTLLRFFGSPEGGYNLCHYWSNFEIASLNLWRDPRYQDYFDYLDSTGNFFYERWGDAIVHSLAAGLFLNKSQEILMACGALVFL
ncbi:hypothetical protein G6F64_009584 [Rhizopus arrhizus]|uniref:Uncharacterized protein n=1 Tax=Rhizopus oryzae TaxID=64495 RepID=A0A9P7BP69_RHIOR|nr:hypothetical protein G6F64_009584 [Rhizopus arrhizus]